MFVRKIREGVGGEVRKTKHIRFMSYPDDEDDVFAKSYRWLKAHPNVYDVVFCNLCMSADKDILELEYTEVE